MTEERPMDFLYAVVCLAICKRVELRDHYFGDREVDWYFDSHHVANGYFSGTQEFVVIYAYLPGGWEFKRLAQFEGAQAQELSKVGIDVQIERNDRMGPSRYGGR